MGWWSCSSGPASARFEATFAAELKEVFGIRDRGEALCRHVADLIDLRITESAQRIRELRRLRKDLTGLADIAARFDPTDCPAYSICRILTPTS